MKAAPAGIGHVVEVAFAANLEADGVVLETGGSIATYATDSAAPRITFRPLVFQNACLFFLGRRRLSERGQGFLSPGLEPRAFRRAGPDSKSPAAFRFPELPGRMNSPDIPCDGGVRAVRVVVTL